MTVGLAKVNVQLLKTQNISCDLLRDHELLSRNIIEQNIYPTVKAFAIDEVDDDIYSIKKQNFTFLRVCVHKYTFNQSFN